MPVVGYSTQNGAGVGVNNNGITSMYYPGVNHNAPTQNANRAINNANTLAGTLGTAGFAASYSNSTFRLTNGNKGELSPRVYTSGWKGGSRANISTYSVSKVGNGVSSIANVLTTGKAYHDIIRGNPQAITYVDAGFGTAGILTSTSSFLYGVSIPVVGEVVAIYGAGRLAWDYGWYMGVNYGPSKWYGVDDTKWFK